MPLPALMLYSTPRHPTLPCLAAARHKVMAAFLPVLKAAHNHIQRNS